MKCNDLTGEEAVILYENSLPIKGFREKKLKIMKSWQRFGAVPKFLQMNTQRMKIHSDFRGFLRGTDYIIYVGDNTKIYWRTTNRHKRTHPSNHTIWAEFKEGQYNDFDHPYMIDITDLICGKYVEFVNWFNENPLEVKE